MKFGKSIRREFRKSGGLAFLNFKYLKRILKRWIGAAHAGQWEVFDKEDQQFRIALESELNRINETFKVELRQILQLQMRIQQSLPSLDRNLGSSLQKGISFEEFQACIQTCFNEMPTSLTPGNNSSLESIASNSEELRDFCVNLEKISSQCKTLRRLVLWNAIAVIKILKKRQKNLIPAIIERSSMAPLDPAAIMLSKQEWYRSPELARVVSIVDTTTDTIMQRLTGQLPSREQYECPICLDVILDPVSLRTCGHRFCWACLCMAYCEKWEGALELCPYCRAAFPLNPDAFVVDGILNRFLKTFFPESQLNRLREQQETLRHKFRQLHEQKAIENQQQKESVNGSFSTHIEIDASPMLQGLMDKHVDVRGKQNAEAGEKTSVAHTNEEAKLELWFSLLSHNPSHYGFTDSPTEGNHAGYNLKDGHCTSNKHYNHDCMRETAFTQTAYQYLGDLKTQPQIGFSPELECVNGAHDKGACQNNKCTTNQNGFSCLSCQSPNAGRIHAKQIDVVRHELNYIQSLDTTNEGKGTSSAGRCDEQRRRCVSNPRDPHSCTTTLGFSHVPSNQSCQFQHDDLASDSCSQPCIRSDDTQNHTLDQLLPPLPCMHYSYIPCLTEVKSLHRCHSALFLPQIYFNNRLTNIKNTLNLFGSTETYSCPKVMLSYSLDEAIDEDDDQVEEECLLRGRKKREKVRPHQCPSSDTRRLESLCSLVTDAGIYKHRCKPVEKTAVQPLFKRIDALEGLERLPLFFPNFARENLEHEHNHIRELIWTYLKLSPEELCRNNSKFTHFSRALTTLPETAILNFEFASTLLINLWKLYSSGYLTVDHEMKIVDILNTRVTSIRTNFTPQSWMCETAKSSFVSSEQLRTLGKHIDWKHLFDILHNRYMNRGYRGPVDISCNTRKRKINATVGMVECCRFLWDSEEVGKELMKRLDFNFSRESSCYSAQRPYYETRMMVLFVGKAFWHRLMVSGQLMEWWRPKCDRQSNSWDILFSRVLHNAIHYGWSKGVPLFDICRPIRRFIFHLLTSSLFLPVTPNLKISFTKDIVPGEYTQLIPGQQCAYTSLAKVIALLLEPLSGPITIKNDRAVSFRSLEPQSTPCDAWKETIPSMWELLETLINVLFPLTHPGDSDKWTVPISRFIAAFVTAYTRRVARERMSSDIIDFRVSRAYDGTTVKSYRLGVREDARIIKMLLPLLLQGIYSKSLNAVTAYESTIKRLCYLNPDLTLPTLSEQILPALETVTDSHRVQSALRILIQICPFLLQRMSHLIPDLLSLTLQGIDPSDPFKTVQVLTFYVVLFAQLPVRDLSACYAESTPLDDISNEITRYVFPQYNESSPLISWQNYPKETVQQNAIVDKCTNMTQHSQTVCTPYASGKDPTNIAHFWSPEQIKARLLLIYVSSSVIPTWTVDFFNQVLHISSHSVKIERSSTGVLSSVDRSLFIAMKFCLTQLFIQCDELLLLPLLETFRDWILSSVRSEGVDMASLICRSFAQTHPDLALKILFKPIYSRIFQFYNETKGTSPILSNSPEEKSLNWFMECLSNLLRVGPGHLFPYRQDIVSIVCWSLHHSNKNVAHLGLKCLRRTIESCTILTLDLATIPKLQNASHVAMVDSLARFGTPWWLSYKEDLERIARTPLKEAAFLPVLTDKTKNFLHLSWQSPTETDLLFAQYLVFLGLHYAEGFLSICVPKTQVISDLKLTSLATQGSDSGKFSDVSELASSLNLPDFNSISRDINVLGMSPRQLLQRVLSTGKQILKALGSMNPDDRQGTLNGFPVVFPGSTNLAIPVVNFLVNVCVSVSRVYLGLQIDNEQMKVDYVTPLVEVRGTEDSVLIRKLLKAAQQLLLRKGCVWSVNAQAAMSNKLWVTLNTYTSATSGVHHLARNQDFLRCAIIERILRQWNMRIELRRLQHEFSGYRRSLILLVARLGTHFYSQGRTLAQDILKSAFSYHYGARSPILGMLLGDLRTGILGLTEQEHTNEAPAVSCNAKTLLLPSVSAPRISRSSPQLTQVMNTDEVCHEAVTVTSPKRADAVHNETVLELSYARITGVTYILSCSLTLKRVWRSPSLLSEVLLAVCRCFKAPIVRPQLHSRLFSLVYSIVNAREPVCQNTQEYQTHIVEGFLPTLFKDLSLNTVDNWRYQFIATCFLAPLNSPCVKATEEPYALWLLASCSLAKNCPLLNSLALFCLTLYLNEKLTALPSTTPSGMGLFPIAVASAFQNSSTIEAIASALIHVHHENCTGTSSSYPDTPYQILLDILKLDTTWPTNNFPRESNYLSLHNCLTVSTVLDTQKKVTQHTSLEGILNPWRLKLEEFLKCAVGEKEYYVTCCEIVAGILNIANSWGGEQVNECWTFLYPEISRLFQMLDQEQFLDFIDAMRFGADISPLVMDRIPILKDQSTAGLPLMKFCLSPESPLNFDSPDLPSFTLMSATTSGRSSLTDTKRLKLIVLILRLFETKAVSLVKSLLPCIPSLLVHPYAQMRSETSKCLSCLLSLFQSNSHDHKTLYSDTLSSSIHQMLSDTADQYFAYFHHNSLENDLSDMNTERPTEFMGTETLMLTTSAIFQNFFDAHISPCIFKLLPLFFECIKLSDVTLNDLTRSTLVYIALRIGCDRQECVKLEDHEYETSDTSQSNTVVVVRSSSHDLEVFLKMMELQLSNTSWKIRCTTMRLVQILSNQYRMKMFKTTTFDKLIGMCINELTDVQSEVRETAQSALTSLSLSLSSDEYIHYAKSFTKLKGESRASSLNTMGSVLGLAALVQSAPYHIPDWLPETIVSLALFGGKKSADNIRRHVEKSLQEFFRTHCDAWNQSHVNKFSAAQIEILNTYKGRPHYFS